MDFANLRDRAAQLAGSASDMAGKALDDFNASLTTMRALGFTVEDLHVAMGLPPEIHARLIAAADQIDSKALDDIIKKKEEQKTLVALLKALQTAYNVRDQLGDLGLKGVEMNVTFAIPPKISVGFLKSASVSASASNNAPA